MPAQYEGSTVIGVPQKLIGEVTFTAIHTEWTKGGSLHRLAIKLSDGRVLCSYRSGWEAEPQNHEVTLWEPTDWLENGGYEHSTITSYTEDREGWSGSFGAVYARRSAERHDSIEEMHRLMESALPGITLVSRPDSWYGTLYIAPEQLLDLVGIAYSRN